MLGKQEVQVALEETQNLAGVTQEFLVGYYLGCRGVYVLKAFGQFLMETFSLVGWIIHLSFVGAAGDVKPEFVL